MSAVEVDKSWPWSMSDLSTYDWLTDIDILSKASLPARIYFNSNTQKITNMIGHSQEMRFLTVHPTISPKNKYDYPHSNAQLQLHLK